MVQQLGPRADPSDYGFFNAAAEVSRILGTDFFDPNELYVVVSDGPGNGGRPFDGFAYLPENDFLGLTGVNTSDGGVDRWAGS